MTDERAFWLGWLQIGGVGPVLLRRLHQYFGKLSLAWEATPRELIQVEGVGEQTAELIAAERKTLNLEDLLKQHLRQNPHFWTPDDGDYPRLLLEIPDPPPLLYYRGKVNREENQGNKPVIAIIGTRSPSEYGKRWTRRISKALTEKGFTIVSGLAEGVDADAHRSCLEAQGRTWAVLGTGVDQIYPWSNRYLYQQVLEQGLALSEYPAGTLPDRTHFPRRNRIVAGLCRAVLVMEAPEKSGALITARLANDYGRDVYVLPGSLDNPRSQGCLALINQGAQVILGEDHLLEILGAIPTLAPEPQEEQLQIPLVTLQPELQRVLQALKDLSQEKPEVNFDRLVGKTGLTAGEVSGALLQLELMNQVSHLPGMHYRLT